MLVFLWRSPEKFLINNRIPILIIHLCKEWSLSCSVDLSSQFPGLWVKLCTLMSTHIIFSLQILEADLLDHGSLYRCLINIGKRSSRNHSPFQATCLTGDTERQTVFISCLTRATGTTVLADSNSLESIPFTGLQMNKLHMLIRTYGPPNQFTRYWKATLY